ncbi:MAG: alpha-amylase [Chloroflexi bacterium]|nr:alpha-amylase [Chloroflexota bacterium]
MREFHVSRDSRDYYQFDLSLFAFTGNVVLANFHGARVFAQQINARRDVVRYPERAAKASQINAMGLIDEVLHLLIAEYRRQVNPNLLRDALQAMAERDGTDVVEATLRQFSANYPPLAVYRHEIDLDRYLSGETAGESHWQIALEEMLMLWLANANPAFSPYKELFDDSALEKHTAYPKLIDDMQGLLGQAKGLGPGGETLFDMLRAPALASPNSLSGQLEFIRTRYGALLPAEVFRLLSSLDFIAEEEKAVFFGPGPVETLKFGEQAHDEPEQYSPDTEWMPRLVLLAKNAYVWLDQLSKQYGLDIASLDQVPDAELDILAERGITGLWLIGLWERSKASKRIKQMMGNPEAVASAYSLYDYNIAHDLGGPPAMDNLRQRAWQRGIRMSSDMVPNHMAIDSRWVMEHPHWFLSLDHSPYPNYSFNGPDLSEDERVGIYLEDHYYDRSDASVVFKRVDHQTGDARYIYHGNDGTMMPWNDTAQLDYLKAEVREAVIQTILHVARQFPIIRFDAAMTLAKKHIQRLWFPEPGSGGDIATRAEHGMTREQFDQAMPAEFWREVVDRVAEEVPDTLLLAEAFWLLEGYFVRTLGMHRVYNSAFMHMLRDEDNDKYRQLIKNTVEFDPEILKRYVNFMSNPDEETAVAQFEKGDKYFGVASVLATVPGLPMFGHGQFEGYAEKYGMEYRKAYRDEEPDTWLIDRHMREIVPLLRRRYLFADVHNFLLYDFFSSDGAIDENVIAYSNRFGDESSLIIYHNRWGDTRGWVRTSTAYLDKGSGQMLQKTLGEGLKLPYIDSAYVIFRDYANGLEYIRSSKKLVDEGMKVNLGAYQRHVFLDFRIVQDNQWHQYSQLTEYLAGRGVPDVEEAVKELFLQALHFPYRALINAEVFRWLMDARVMKQAENQVTHWSKKQQAKFEEIEIHVTALYEEVKVFAQEQRAVTDTKVDVDILRRRVVTLEAEGDIDDVNRSPEDVESEPVPPPVLEALVAHIQQEVEAALLLPAITDRYPPLQVQAASIDPEDATPPLSAATYLLAGLDDAPAAWGALFAWIFSHSLGKVIALEDYASQTRTWMDEWLLGKIVAQALQDFGLTPDQAWRSTSLLKLLISHQDLLLHIAGREELPDDADIKVPYRLLDMLLQDEDVRSFLHVNRYGGILWYNRQAFGELMHGLFAVSVLTQTAGAEDAPAVTAQTIDTLYETIVTLRAADEQSQYEVEKLRDLVR